MWFTRLTATETKSAWKTKATRSSVLFQSLSLSADPRRAMQGPPRTQEAGPAEGAGGMDRRVGSLLPLDPERKEPGPLPPGHFCPASWSEQPEVATSRPSCKDRDLTLPTSLPPPSPLREHPLPLMQVLACFSGLRGDADPQTSAPQTSGPAPPSPTPGDSHCASRGSSVMGDTREMIGGR